MNLDFLGPLPTGEMLLVVIDQHSRFPEVEIMTTTTAAVVIQKLDRIFATHGIPSTIVSDNGALPFNSAKIPRFFNENGVRHRRITPLWPQANSEAESFMKPLQAAHAEGRNSRRDLQKFLLNFRKTSHSTTSISPAELLFNRKIKEKLPCFSGVQDLHSRRSSALLRDVKRKSEAKKYADARRGATPSHLKVGDAVFVRS